MRVRIAEPALAITLIVASTGASAKDIRLDIPAGTLGQALIALGEQAHITIGITDSRLAAIRSPGLHGRMDVREALAKLFHGTGHTFVFNGRAVRIIPAAPVAADRSPVQSPAETRSEAEVGPAEIIVTASKQDVRET